MSVGRLTSHLDQDVGLNALSDVFRQPTDFDPDIKDTLNPYNEAVEIKHSLEGSDFTSLDEKELLSLAKNFLENYQSIEYGLRRRQQAEAFYTVDGVVSVDKVGAIMKESYRKVRSWRCFWRNVFDDR